MEIVPHQKLVYTRQGGMGKENLSLDSIITWTLMAKGEGTELQLVHSSFKGIKNYLSYFIMNKGWVNIGERITKLLKIS